LGKLVERGNRVVVAYGVSGDMAVRDKTSLACWRRAIRFLKLLSANASRKVKRW
jgi:hypothetical protein